jgi:hypothetical protein
MFTDRENTFDLNAAVTVTRNSTDVLLVPTRMRNTRMRWYWQVPVAFNNLTSLQGKLVASSTADLATAPRTLLDSGAVVLATLNAAPGYRFDAVMPDLLNAEKYIGVVWTVVGTAPTLGQVTSGLVEAAETLPAQQQPYFTGLT